MESVHIRSTDLKPRTHFRKGEIEWRRDSLVLAVAFLVISMMCTRMVLRKLNDITYTQKIQSDAIISLMEKTAVSEKQNNDIMKRLMDIESNAYALAELQKSNIDEIRAIKKIIAQQKK